MRSWLRYGLNKMQVHVTLTLRLMVPRNLATSFEHGCVHPSSCVPTWRRSTSASLWRTTRCSRQAFKPLASPRCSQGHYSATVQCRGSRSFVVAVLGKPKTPCQEPVCRPLWLTRCHDASTAVSHRTCAHASQFLEWQRLVAAPEPHAELLQWFYTRFGGALLGPYMSLPQ